LVVAQHDIIIKGAKICSFQWQDDYVIYDQLSGDTHFVEGVGGELILALSERSMSRMELLNKLNELFEDATELETETYLDDFIARFQKLGLLDIE
jgi:PqqD family protein of HPr-rel-A system